MKMDELQLFIEQNLKDLPKDLTQYQIIQELKARVNDVYALNPNDESYVTAIILEMLKK